MTVVEDRIRCARSQSLNPLSKKGGSSVRGMLRRLCQGRRLLCSIYQVLKRHALSDGSVVVFCTKYEFPVVVHGSCAVTLQVVSR